MTEHACSLGGRLRRWRRFTGFEQRELARRAGVWPQTLCAYERDRHAAPVETVRKIADAMGVPLHVFWGWLPPEAVDRAAQCSTQPAPAPETGGPHDS